MIRVALTALAFSAAFAVPASAADYKIVDRIKLPDGGWDYITSDPEHGRIYRTRTDGTDVMMGDLVLLQEEVNPVMSALLDNGIEVTAMHRHLNYPAAGTQFGNIGIARRVAARGPEAARGDRQGNRGD